MKRSALLLIVPLLLVGCRTSTRTIELQQGTLSVEPPRHFSGTIAYAFSKDGSKMIGFTEGADNTTVSHVVDTTTGETLAMYSSEDTEWVPLMFTKDGMSIVFARGIAGKPTTVILPIGEPLPRHEMGREGSGVDVSLPNADWSLWAGDTGIVINDEGKTVTVEDAARSPLFDMYGNIWYLVRGGGWKRVDKHCTVQSLPKPSYLVGEPFMRKGAMRLHATEQEMQYEHANANVSAIWLHHDRAKGGLDGDKKPRNLSALVYAGADVFWMAFVPGKDLVSISTGQETLLVPYKVE